MQIVSIRDFPGYHVSEDGTVWKGLTAIKAQDNSRGYLRVDLRRDGKKHQRMIHRLVAEAFVPNPCFYKVVNHINGNKLDNRAQNLEWVTHQENSLQAALMVKRKKRPIARINPLTKTVQEIFISASSAARYYACDYRSLYNALQCGAVYLNARWTYINISIN